MAKGKALATAYIQLIPSMDGAQSEIKHQLGVETDGLGESVGSSLGSKIKKAIIAAGIGKALTDSIKAGLNEGAALEQSIGGIETLFKGSADTVKNYAMQAYKTAGLSANEYMENVTSFSASLISSCGNDTAKAAQIANRAMIDMSDNANKMGTDIESLQNAYQGFAKQNYTMLDNLKLGYGGTKEEMARLIHEASQMTDVQDKLNIKVKDGDMSFANIANAISVVQDNLGIAGTTAEEASETFSGSFSAMKAAAQNLFGYMALGMDEEVNQAIPELIDTASVFLFDNALPMIGRFVSAIPGVLARGFSSLADRIRTAGTDGMSGFMEGIAESVPALIAAFGNFVSAGISWIWDNRYRFVEIGRKCLQAFFSSFGTEAGLSAEQVGQLSKLTENIIKGLALFKMSSAIKGFVDPVVKMFSTGGPLSKLFGESGLIGKIITPMKTAFTAAEGGLAGMKAALSTLVSPVAIAGAAVTVLTGAFATLWASNEDFREGIKSTWNQLMGIFQDIGKRIVDVLNNIGFDFENFGEVMDAFVQGVKNVWQGFCEFLGPIFEGSFQFIVDSFQLCVNTFFDILDIFVALFTGDWEGAWESVKQLFSDIWDGITAYFTNILDTLRGLADVFLGWFGTDWETVWSSVSGFFGDIWNGISNFFSKALDGLRGIFDWFGKLFTGDWEGVWNGVYSFASGIWGNISDAITGAWDGIKNWFTNTADSVFSAIAQPFQDAYNFCIGIYNAVNDLWGGVDAAYAGMQSTYSRAHGGGGSNNVLHAEGGIFTRATLIPTLNANHVVGEAGAEAILPLADFYSHLDQSLQANDSRSSADLAALLGKLDEVIQAVDIKLDGRSVAKSVDRHMQRMAVAR